MDYKQKYNYWSQNTYFDAETREELAKIKDDEKEIEERFYTELAFGTGGLRGIIGAGTNRMNRYTVRKATQGFANYINNVARVQSPSVVIAYDSRFMSREFAFEAAAVFTGNGIKTYVFNELRPTPELSFAVRELKATAGIVITASHNPKQYNGYKAYWDDGGQIPPERADAVIEEIDKIKDYTNVILMDSRVAENKGLLNIIGKEIDDRYIANVKKVSVDSGLVKKVADSFKVVFTPLHGTGNIPVRRVLLEIGLKNVIIVPEQENPDPGFSTVKYPNPEEKDAFKLAIELAQKEDVDLIIGTDPDADRIGVVVRNAEGEYVTLTGNQTGALLTEYLLSKKKEAGTLPADGAIIKTIVTTEMARAIAKHYGVELVEVLTGFKFIGEKIKEFEETGDKQYIFGFEESYGYLAGTHARDKDAVVAAMLICEMACYYKSRGITLYEGLQDVFKKYGYYKEGLVSYTLEGKEGIEKIKQAMRELREKASRNIGEYSVKAVRDYELGFRLELDTGKKEKLELPKSDVLYYEMEDGSWFCVRPSGTEPKIKMYMGIAGESLEDSEKRLNSFKKAIVAMLEKLLF